MYSLEEKLLIKYTFDKELLNNKTQLFPDAICDDPWVLYHGTSNLAEMCIEEGGIFRAEDNIQKEDVEKVVNIYKVLNWCGVDQGGLAVLEPFSLLHDFSEKNVGAIYMAETSYRALLYATYDFAGGEVARALRKAINDIDRYFSEPKLRYEHLDMLKMEYEQTGKVGMPQECIDMFWLESELRCLESIRRKSKAPQEQYAYGIVYAVRFNENDCQNLRYHQSMGVIASGTIRPEKMVAKVLIPSDFNYVFQQYDRRIKSIVERIGIIGALQR